MPATPDTSANFTATTITNNPLSPTATSLTVATGTGAGLPSTFPFMGMLGTFGGAHELVQCTARASDTVTIVRAQEGTVGQQWVAGTPFASVFTAGMLANIWTLIRTLAYSPEQFGAVGDGVTDDAPAFRLLAAALLAAGGGKVRLRATTYLFASTIANPNDATIAAECFWAPSRTEWEGEGEQTILKLGAGLPNQTYLCTNYRPGGGGGDEGIVFRHMLCDGNAAANNGGTIDAQYGPTLVRVRRARFEGVVARNFYGTTSGGNGPNGTNGESAQMNATSCLDVVVHACHAYCDASQVGSGISINSSTNVAVSDSIGERCTLGMGITIYECQHVAMSNCQAYLNGHNGLNFEFCTDVRVSGSAGGGQMSSYTPSGLWYAASASLGNGASGLSFLSCAGVWVYGCAGAYNTQHGLTHYGAGAGQARIHGGDYSNNGAYGVNLDANSKHTLQITGRPTILSNTTAAVATGDTLAPSMAALEGAQTAPAMPATGAGITNPFPCAMLVRLSGGTMTSTQIGPQGGTGASMLGASEGRLLVLPNWFITPNYSATSTWTWMAEPA